MSDCQWRKGWTLYLRRIFVIRLRLNFMPNTKKSITRLVVIDRCLSGKYKMTMDEMLQKVNDELRAQQRPIVKYPSTIHRDIEYIEQQWKTEVIMKPKGKEFTYEYKDPSFSIFKSSLTPSELIKLYEIIDQIKDFTGLPQFDWLEEVCNRIQFSTLDESERKPIVKFARNPAMAQYRKFFNPLFEVIQDKKAIELTYQRFEAEASRTYVVHPYELMEYEARWYLVASVDHHPESLTTFCFDRIVDFKESKVPFRKNTKFDTDEYFNPMVGLTRPDDAEPQEVLLWVDNSEYPYLKTKPIHESQKLVREENGGKVISLHAIVNIELMMALLSYGKWIKVLAPPELRQKMKDNVKAMSSYYEDSDS